MEVMMGLRLPRPQRKSKVIYVVIVDSDKGPSNNAVISEEVARGSMRKNVRTKRSLTEQTKELDVTDTN